VGFQEVLPLTPDVPPIDVSSISVVICAYTDERWDDVISAVESVRRQTAAPKEIIVVVDHSPTLLKRVRHALPQVNTIPNAGPRGLSGARNSGVVAATGSVVAFLDDDARAAPDWLERIALAYRDPRVIGVGGTSEPVWPGKRPAWFPVEFDWVVGCTYRGMPEQTSQVRNLIGSNMSLRRDVLEQLGGFRSGIGRAGMRPVGCEETELCIRAAQRWPDTLLLYEPRARVSHRVSPGRATWKYFRSRCFSEGLSKALVSRLVGADDGLATERAYVRRTLPLGVVHGLSDAVCRQDLGGLARAAAISTGLLTTAAGYVLGRLLRVDAASLDGASPSFGPGLR
jgi:glycosyltransferase involved in cell wall biosynthesis